MEGHGPCGQALKQPPRPGNTSGHPSSRDALRRIQEYHDEAYLYIEQGLTCDEGGQKEQAVTLYSKGLHCVDLAFDVPQGELQEAERKRGGELLSKMEKIRGRIMGRVEVMIRTDAGVAQAIDNPPPSYDEATTPTQSEFDMLLELDDPHQANARELFTISDGVQIFYITKEGYVSAPSYPSSLAIYRFSEHSMSDRLGGGLDVADVFLRVSDWTYPLIPGRSPVLQADWGAYVFPDVTSSSDGNAVGVILPDSTAPTERARFERILNEHTDLRNQATTGSEEPVLPPGESAAHRPCLAKERTSEKISRGLETAAEWITWGVVKGAEKTGQLMKRGSAKLQENLAPEREPSKVDPAVQKGAHYTRQATDGLVRVSGFIVKKLGEGTMALARSAAPHLRKQSQKYLPESFVRPDDDGKSTLDDVVTVAAGGLKGWATIYVGLEQAAKTLSRTLADETVHVVQHKYGRDAGSVTGDVMYSGANIAFTAYHATNLGPTALAKRTAKDTGCAVVEDHHQAINRPQQASNGQEQANNGKQQASDRPEQASKKPRQAKDT